MAIHLSVIKRQRQSLKRRERNKQTRAMIRTLIKKARQAIEVKDRESASAQLREVNRALSNAVGKGVLKQRTASRWLSRLTRSTSRLAASQ